jgi:hypothetical protein
LVSLPTSLSPVSRPPPTPFSFPFLCTLLNSPRQVHPCQISASATAIVRFAQRTVERKRIVACVRMLNSANFAGKSLAMSLSICVREFGYCNWHISARVINISSNVFIISVHRSVRTRPNVCILVLVCFP